jgi:hypothetical protein
MAVTAVSWLAILVLGPGALLIFAWFLLDVRQLLGGLRDLRHDGDDRRD